MAIPLKPFLIFGLITLTFVPSPTASYEVEPLDPDNSDEVEKYPNEVDRDAHIITHSLKRLVVRPDNPYYPYILKASGGLLGPSDVEERNNNEVTITYYTPKKSNETEFGEAGTIQEEVTIKTNYIDWSKEVTVFPTGDKGLGYPIKGAYIVIRNTSDSVNSTRKYVNIAYIRRQIRAYSVEWSILDASLFGRNRLEQELCRGATCELHHYILGTCGIVANHCKLQGVGDPSVVNKYTWPKNLDETKNKKKEEVPKRRRRQVALEEEAENEEAEHLPSSLDLLMLKRSSDAQGGEDEAHYENILMTKREVGKGGEIQDCIGCEKMDNYYDDFIEDPALSKLIGEEVKKLGGALEQDIFIGIENQAYIKGTIVVEPPPPVDDNSITTTTENPPTTTSEKPKGSLTVVTARPPTTTSTTPSPLLLNDSVPSPVPIPRVPYLGYGPCNISNKQSVYEPEYTMEPEDLEVFFLGTMRLYCDHEKENKVRQMFTSKLKLLEIQKDFSIGLAHDSRTMKYKILTSDEFRQVMTGALMARYVYLYRDNMRERSLKVGRIHPSDERVSWGMRFFSKLMFNVLDLLQGFLNPHYIRGQRFLLRSLRDKFNTLLVQAATQSQPPALRETLINDLYRVMALKEFIIYGNGPIIKSGAKSGQAFRSFENENEKRIKRLVAAYGIN